MRFLPLILIWSVFVAGQRPVDYKLALPGYRFQFPRDHGSHPEYQLEWWYFTGQVRTDSGREFGYELTFFRRGVDRMYDNPSNWAVLQLHMAHFALSDLAGRRFHFFEKLNREGPGIAGADTGTLHSWNENWSVQLDAGAIRLRATAGGSQIDFALVPEKTPVIHGENGISQKAEGAGHASHYYSLSRLRTSGRLVINGVSQDVRGRSWMDHEFGTNQLSEDQIGWDWFGLQLDNGTDLMIYRMRRHDGAIDPNSSGTIVFQDSRTRRLVMQDFDATPERYWKSLNTGAGYPIDWHITLASQGVDLHVTARLDGQELVTTRPPGIAYWEGAVQVRGTWKGKPITGRGYVELTGYAAGFRPGV